MLKIEHLKNVRLRELKGRILREHWMEKKVAIISGANRGLGLAVSRALAFQGYHLILVGRREQELKELVEEFASVSQGASYQVVDFSQPPEVDRLLQWLKDEVDQIDVLINNAAVFLEGRTEPPEIRSALEVGAAVVEMSFRINALVPYQLMQAVAPIMKKQNYGRIVNVSSGMGGLNSMAGGWPAYRSSKTALNAFTKIFAEELRPYNIKINSVCPGWVKTQMGGENAPRTLEEGIQGIIWAATLDDEGPSGGFFRDGRVIPW